LHQLLAQMQGHRRALRRPRIKTLRCAQRLYHIGKLHGIQRIHPLGQVRHLLLVVSRQQRVTLYGIAVFRQRHAAWRSVRTSSRISLKRS
jgi:hypothetical protein